MSRLRDPLIWKRNAPEGEFDTSFISAGITNEPCPECGSEVDITCDGKTDCPECGEKNILPCMECKLANDYYNEDGGSAMGPCDWYEDTGCTPFPNKNKC